MEWITALFASAAMFIVSLFGGATPEAPQQEVVRSTATTEVTEHSRSETIEVPLSRSGSYVLPIPSNWRYSTGVFKGGGVEHEQVYIYDENGLLIMVATSPIREIGYEPMRVEEKKVIVASIGDVDVSLHVDRESNGSFGFARYSWFGSDFWKQSFEIFVRYGQEVYAKTAEEYEAGRGDTLRFSTLQDLKTEQVSIEEMIANIHVR